jgi:hypothetical protein
MNIKKDVKESQEFKKPTLCYEKNGIVFVPHHTKIDCYAYPGIAKKNSGYSSQEMEAMGATLATRYLFANTSYQGKI